MPKDNKLKRQKLPAIVSAAIHLFVALARLAGANATICETITTFTIFIVALLGYQAYK